jgi:excisionase family DNA binding protein
MMFTWVYKGNRCSAVGTIRRFIIQVKHADAESLYMAHHTTTSNDSIIDQLKHRKAYLKTTEVMAILGVTRATLCGWVRSGSIGAVRIGKDNKFDPLALALWLETRTL